MTTLTPAVADPVPKPHPPGCPIDHGHLGDGTRGRPAVVDHLTARHIPADTRRRCACGDHRPGQAKERATPTRSPLVPDPVKAEP